MYGSSGKYDCAKADGAPLLDNEAIPAWCPLPRHPAKIAAVARRALSDASDVLLCAKGEAESATPARLRELLRIASEQVERGLVASRGD
jgi:hypothetical protein